MTMTFVNTGNDGWLPPRPNEARCYVVAMEVNGAPWKHFKAIFPADWDRMEPSARYHYTRLQAIAYFRGEDGIDEQFLAKITAAYMTIYNNDWAYHLDDGVAAVYITAQQMEDIFVDCWNHPMLS